MNKDIHCSAWSICIYLCVWRTTPNNLLKRRKGSFEMKNAFWAGNQTNLLSLGFLKKIIILQSVISLRSICSCQDTANKSYYNVSFFFHRDADIFGQQISVVKLKSFIWTLSKLALPVLATVGNWLDFQNK